MRHLQDKEMVNDILSQTNSSISNYAKVITETANPQLRQTLQQIRNGDEQFQYQLFQLANQKGWYKPASDATQQEISQVKQQLTSG